MLAMECNTYEEFRLGLCFGCGEDGRHCAMMGHRADEEPMTRKRKRVPPAGSEGAASSAVAERKARRRHGRRRRIRRHRKFYLNTGSAKGDFCRKNL